MRNYSNLNELLRDALRNLYDPIYLRSHRFEALMPHGFNGATPDKGEAVQQRLIETIDTLRPKPVVPSHARSWRRHRVLSLRYVEQLEVSDIARQLGISRREYYRELNRSLSALEAIVQPGSNGTLGPMQVPIVPSSELEQASSIPASLGMTPGPTPSMKALPSISPFTGRAKEIEFASALWDAIADGGEGRLMLLSGEAGIGKTRFAEELGAYAQHHKGAFLRGRCVRDGDVAYSPLIEVLRAATRSVTTRQLREIVGPHGRELARMLPEVEENLKPFSRVTAEGAGAQRFLLHDGITEFLVGLSRRTPLFILVDDLQWASELSLLTHLARRLPEAHIFLLAVCRDQELEDDPSLARSWAELSRLHHSLRMHLSPLSEKETAWLVAHHLGTGPADKLCDLVYRCTRGNPFFVEGVLYTLVENETVRWGANGWVVGDISTVRLPQSANLLLRERVQRLGEAVRETLAQAAVLGHMFTFSVLRQMTGLAESDLAQHVGQAVTARILLDRSSTSEERFEFADDRVREALYDTVPSPVRRRRHLFAGRAIETIYGDGVEKHIEALAYHFIQAADFPKGVDYCCKAGAKAERAFAWNQAIHWYREALELCAGCNGRREQLAELCVGLGELSFLAGRTDESNDYFRRALDIFDALGNRLGLIKARIYLGRALIWESGMTLAKVEDGVRQMRITSDLAERNGELEHLGWAHAHMGMGYTRLGCLLDAIEHTTKALEIGERLNAPSLMSRALTELGWELTYMGKIAEGRDALERGWILAKENLVKFSDGAKDQELVWPWSREITAANTVDINRTITAAVATVLKNPVSVIELEARKPDCHTIWSVASFPVHLATANVLLGNLEKASEILESIRRRLGPSNALRDSGYVLSFAQLLRHRGEWDQAQRVLRGSHELTTVNHGIEVLLELAELSAEIEDYSAAEDYLSQALDFHGHDPGRLLQLRVIGRLCMLKAYTDEPQAASAYLRKAEDIVAQTSRNWEGLTSEFTLAAGLVRSAEGKWTEADDGFADAIRIARQYELRWDAAKMQYEWARAIIRHSGSELSAPRREFARQLVGKAGESWRTMGAPLYAEHCQTLLTTFGHGTS